MMILLMVMGWVCDGSAVDGADSGWDVLFDLGFVIRSRGCGRHDLGWVAAVFRTL